MVLQFFYVLSRKSGVMSIIASCSMFVLTFVLNLFNPAAVLAQSTVIVSPRASASLPISNVAVPNSLTASQLSTEAMMSRPVATIGIRRDTALTAAELSTLLDAVVFIDVNLEGVLDGETQMEVKAGVSIGTALRSALHLADSSMIVESNGSILVISIDDEDEPDYLRNVTYDLTRLSGSVSNARALASAVMNTIYPDSWEMNGGGNGAISIYSQNGHVLMTINQSYRVHSAIRNHFDTVARLSGALYSPPVVQGRNAIETSAPSSVVAVPVQQTTKSFRSRRGFARPNSGTSGGMGGGGSAGGGVF